MLDSPQIRRDRLPVIDALRGAALVAMIVYHFSWDLAYHGFVRWDVTGDPVWRGFAIAIAGSFLLLSGVALALAARGGLDPSAFVLRLAKIAAAAALVSVASWFMFPDSWIFFGILHMIAAGSVIGLAFLALPPVVTFIAAALALAVPSLLRGGVFDAAPLAFLGLSETAPISNDFVPVFPWLAPVLVGIALGRMIASGRIRLPATAMRGGLERALVTAGRWTLPIYLVHQPVLFGLVAAAASVLPANPEIERDRFVAECRPIYGDAFCGCVAEALQGTDYWAVRGGDPELSALVSTAGMACRAGETPFD
ncbi:MAG TPA: heparan-alpha-glucosaminide N-acetyltransferase [Methylomirabilota bacterium]|nr:heparan-alpha-glucosaminide N-acetyltransferase [Methylomirabilota bacterium]